MGISIHTCTPGVPELSCWKNPWSEQRVIIPGHPMTDLDESRVFVEFEPSESLCRALSNIYVAFRGYAKKNSFFTGY